MSSHPAKRLGSVDPADHPPIAFSDHDWAWFCDRVAALGLPDQQSLREDYQALYGHLVGVNEWLNLTRLTDPRDYLKQHVLDSLTLWGERRFNHLSEGSVCIDLGSGGGYPGLPLALNQPRVPWVLVDSRQRKVTFLAAAAEIAKRARVSARCFRGREVAAQAADLRRAAQLVVTRATGPVDKLLLECAPLLAPRGRLVVYKGPSYEQEEHERAEKAGKRCDCRFISVQAVQLEETDPERLLVVFEREH